MKKLFLTCSLLSAVMYSGSSAHANDLFTLKCETSAYIDGRRNSDGFGDMTRIWNIDPTRKTVRTPSGEDWDVDEMSSGEIRISSQTGYRKFTISRLDGSIESNSARVPTGKIVQWKGSCEKIRARF